MKVYAVIDERNRVLTAQSEEWITDLDSGNWHETDAEYEENYENSHMPFEEEHGIPIYKLVGKTIIRRSEEEILADIGCLPHAEPTELEMLRADIDYLLMIMEEE